MTSIFVAINGLIVFDVQNDYIDFDHEHGCHKTFIQAYNVKCCS